MMKPKVSRQHNRIAALVHRPGGQTADEAIAAATANLESARDSTLLELDRMLLRMQDLAQNLQVRPNSTEMTELYAISNTVLGVAGAYGLSGLSGVAYSLCELIDKLRQSNTWNGQSVRLHLDSMVVVQGAKSNREDELAVQHALRLLVDRVPAASTDTKSP